MSTSTLERVPSDCVHCAIEKGLASEDKSETDLSIETGVSTSTLERVPSDCVHCAIEKGLASEDKSETDLSIETGVSFVIIFHFHDM